NRRNCAVRSTKPSRAVNRPCWTSASPDCRRPDSHHPITNRKHHMNGADLLCDTLLAGGVDTCFANPGTSEMHFVAALDRKPQMRCILGLSEGVVTGAADGYARMADKPAATLLH